MATKIWKAIPGLEEWEASMFGDIRKRKTGRVVAKHLQTRYLRVSLRGIAMPVHQLVCVTFHGPWLDGMETSHIDGNPLNNRADKG